jgi:hypothetical protein
MMPDSVAVHASKSNNAIIGREFKTSILQSFDWPFFGLFAGVMVVQLVIMFILASRPVSEFSDKQIVSIHEDYARLAGLTKKPIEEPPVTGSGENAGPGTGGSEASAESSGSEGSGGDRSSNGDGTSETGSGRTSIESRQAMRIASAGMRREQVSREVSNVGILRQLTGTGGTGGTGRAAMSSLDFGTGSGDGEGGDLDQVLSGVDGLATRGMSGSGSGGSGTGGGIRGGRSGRAADIDDLVSDMGSAQSRSMNRKGDLTVEAPSEVAGQGRKSIYRSPDAIQEVLQVHVPAIRYCYERELKRNPELKGKVTIRIVVASDGSVRDAVIVSSTLNNERVERCILSRIKLWKDFKSIDASDGDVAFRQVYTFGY